MKNFKNYISTFFILIFSITAFSQETIYEMQETEIASFLPPLQILIDSAVINNPEIKYSDLAIKANEYKLQSEKTFWMRNLGVQSDVRYGTFNNFSTNTSEGQSPSIIATSKTEANYGVGLYVKFPLYDIINRKNQVGLAQMEIQQAQAKAESQRVQIRQIVISHYNDVVMKHNLFLNKSKNIETERINLNMVEEEFKNGVTPVVEYARIYQIVSMAEDDLQRSKMEYINAVMILEEITGYHFSKSVNNQAQ